MTVEDDQDRLVRRFRRQADTAVQRSSPLYEHLLRGCVADLGQRGPTWLVVQDRAGEPAGDALPLRLLAAVHQLVLRDRAPDLARYYPSVGGDEALDSAWPVFRAVLEEQAGAVRAALDRPLQTNEVGR